MASHSKWYSYTMLNPATRARIAAASGRVGGLTNVARHGGYQVSACARSGFIAHFERMVDPDMRLYPPERAARARAALKAHMAELSLRSAQRRAQ